MGLTVIWSMHLYFYELSSPEVIKYDDNLNDPPFKFQDVALMALKKALEIVQVQELNPCSPMSLKSSPKS